MVRVVLKKDVDGLGKKGETKNVSTRWSVWATCQNVAQPTSQTEKSSPVGKETK
jgi:ribosomal protein L9